MFKFNNTLDFAPRKNDLFIVGEILIDMISQEYCENFENDTYSKNFGGSPGNIAMNVKMLGLEPLFVAAVGDDGFGNYLIRRLKENGNNTKYINKVNYSTSLVVITKSKSSPNAIFYRNADYHIEYTEELKIELGKSKILHFSSWPISQKLSREAIEAMIEDAKKSNVLICFDPNFHPKIWEENHDGIKYIKQLISEVDIIKPSEDDAKRLFGEDKAENHIKKFLDLGAKFVIMTIGKDGAIVSNGEEIRYYESLADEVVDTTGAGDAFWSGFYAGLINGYTLEKALKIGFAVSALKLKSTGAIIKLPNIEQIQKTYNI
ncbi:MAG: carbohydrate kinase family protein [Thermoanaerobacteraceae bacterium]